MAFWELNHRPDTIALIDPSGRAHTYGALKDSADRVADRIHRGPVRDVGFILFSIRPEAVAVYLGALRSGGQVPLLLQPGINPSLLRTLIDIYAPGWIAADPGLSIHADYHLEHDWGSYVLFRRNASEGGISPHPECGLLLSTSGSTGSPKLVRLSYSALAHNAAAIAEYLGLRPDDRAISTLPLAYSFGMSVLNSHLEVGGSLTLTPHNVLTREFWGVALAHDITSLSGVPSTFEMLRRAGLAERRLRRLRMLTQAGGRLSEALTRYFAALAVEHGWLFFVMYGQTEASPRISFVPPRRLSEKIGSIGIAIPGGRLTLDESSGELVYQGPNVMMGYAQSRYELAKPDECHGVLRTGDLAEQDGEGFFYLTGRLSRFVKLSGSRVNLDEVEVALGRILGGKVACVGREDRLVVVVPADVVFKDVELEGSLRDLFNIYAGSVRIHQIATLPEMTNGKIDYKALKALAES